MDRIVKCIRPSTEYEDPESSENLKTLNRIIQGRSDWLSMNKNEKIFKETIEYIEQIKETDSRNKLHHKSFCKKSLEAGMNTDYLIRTALDPQYSALFYYSPVISNHEEYPERKEVIAGLVYSFDDSDKAYHIESICVNQVKYFGIRGWQILNEFKDFVAEASSITGITRIILSSVDSANEFYEKQGFKINTKNSLYSLPELHSNYRERNGTKKWSSPLPIPEVIEEIEENVVVGGSSNSNSLNKVILIEVDPINRSNDKYFVYDEENQYKQEISARPPIKRSKSKSSRSKSSRSKSSRSKSSRSKSSRSNKNRKIKINKSYKSYNPFELSIIDVNDLSGGKRRKNKIK
jgi:hypothetical protein